MLFTISTDDVQFRYIQNYEKIIISTFGAIPLSSNLATINQDLQQFTAMNAQT